jgi:hypothetical protein
VHVEYESIVEATIVPGDILVEVAQEGEVQLLVVLVSCQREEGIYADGQHLGVDLVIEGDIIAGAAELFGAGAGESLGEEEQEHVFPFEIFQGYFFLFGIVEAEAGSWLTDLN